MNSRKRSHLGPQLLSPQAGPWTKQTGLSALRRIVVAPDTVAQAAEPAVSQVANLRGALAEDCSLCVSSVLCCRSPGRLASRRNSKTGLSALSMRTSCEKPGSNFEQFGVCRAGSFHHPELYLL